jgi:acetyl-CoA acetyltransferase
MSHPLNGRVAIAGIGETPNYKRGTSPEPAQKLLLQAIVAACEDAGIDPQHIDGFATYSDDPNNGTFLMNALGTRELRWSTMIEGGGGGGIPGAIAVAGAAIATRQAEIVVVYRTLAERDSGRFNDTIEEGHRNAHYTAQGVWVPAQMLAFKANRMIEAFGVPRSAMDALSFADYFHARNNPHAMAFGNLVEVSDIQASRWVVEPFRLLNCSRETDGAGALIVVSAERARDLRRTPVYLLGAAQGAAYGGGETWENAPDSDYGLALMSSIARRLWEGSGLSPADVDVAQVYENFSGLGVAALIEHGFCSVEGAAEFFTPANLVAPSGKLPVNTGGGCLAEGFVHGVGIPIEGVKQLRGESSNPVPDAKICLVTGGPGSTLSSSILLGSQVAV